MNRVTLTYLTHRKDLEKLNKRNEIVKVGIKEDKFHLLQSDRNSVAIGFQRSGVLGVALNETGVKILINNH